MDSYYIMQHHLINSLKSDSWDSTNESSIMKTYQVFSDLKSKAFPLETSTAITERATEPSFLSVMGQARVDGHFLLCEQWQTQEAPTKMVSEHHREPQTSTYFRAGERPWSKMASKVGQLIMTELRLERRSQEVCVPEPEFLKHQQLGSPVGKWTTVKSYQIITG